MITLKVNNIEVTVPRGSTILQAAEKAGVFVPTLCHDKRITPFGACRLCVVEDRKKPGSLIPSCFTPARDRMEILTETPAVLDAVRTQLQLILVNHPLDCPVCDKAGECTLQDLVIRYNITESPFGTERFARYVDRRSPLIERDMTRCVLCGRCVRICGELQGRDELEFLHRGHRTVVGTDGGRPLDCDFCGLCVSTCPVGALNDKLFKDRTRVWKLRQETTVCSHCGLVCRADFHLEEGRLRRVTPAAASGGEKGLLCARGQFGWRAFESPGRLGAPKLRRDGALCEAGWDEAVGHAAKALDDIRRAHGAASIALLTADHLTTEEAAAWGAFWRDTLGGGPIGSIQAGGYRRILEILEGARGTRVAVGTLRDLDEANVLIVLGGGAAEMHPVLKPLVNSWMKKGDRQLAVVSSWPDALTRRATLALTVGPGLVEEFCAELLEALGPERINPPADLARFGIDSCTLARLIGLLEEKRDIVVLVAPEPCGDNRHKARLAAFLQDRVRAVLPLGGQANSAGAVFEAGFTSGEVAVDGLSLVEAIEAGRIRALYLLGEDPLESLPEPSRVRQAMEKLDCIVCQGPFETTVTGLAHVVLPAALLHEKRGTVLSLLGEKRTLRPVLPPFGRSRPDGEILRALAAALGSEAVPRVPAAPAAQKTAILSVDAVPQDAGQGMPFILEAVPSLFGDGILSRQSPDLAQLRRGLRVVMSAGDFERLGLAEREIVEVRTPFGCARAEAERDAAVPCSRLLLRHAAGSAAGLSLTRPGTSAVPAAIARIGT
ncbi:MAG: molybdopterin-dependent oxidoreductase [Syntrophaceae bacterium]|nr:molybdopterin-dependent oxidoreductase [Syntrophaceae bacterium]